MIFILTALYCEAKPFIDQLSLKKNILINEFPVYERSEISLIISGAGKIKSAAASAFLLKNRKKNGDFFVNIGTCGAISQNAKPGDVVYPSKIIDLDTDRSYYPEMLWKHTFIEGTLVTSSKVMKDKPGPNDWDFVDMESSGIFESASIFLPLSSVISLKVVADNLTDAHLGKITEKFIEHAVLQKSGYIIDFFTKLHESAQANNNLSAFSNEELSLLDTISKKLRLTTTMSIDIKKYALYLKKNEGNLIDLLYPFLEKNIKTKYESKKEYNLLKNVLSQQ